jgi:hypothetical protein
MLSVQPLVLGPRRQPLGQVCGRDGVNNTQNFMILRIAFLGPIKPRFVLFPSMDLPVLPV